MLVALAAGAAGGPPWAAVVIGFFCVRLSSIYFAMLTLAAAQIAYAIVHQWYDVTGGDNGLLGIWPPRPWARPRRSATTIWRSPPAVGRPGRPWAAGGPAAPFRPLTLRGGARPRRGARRRSGIDVARRPTSGWPSSSPGFFGGLRRRHLRVPQGQRVSPELLAVPGLGGAARDGAAGRPCHSLAGAPLGAALYKLLDTVGDALHGILAASSSASSSWSSCSCSPAGSSGALGGARAVAEARGRAGGWTTCGAPFGGVPRRRRRVPSPWSAARIRALIGPNGAGKSHLLQHPSPASCVPTPGRVAPGRGGREDRRPAAARDSWRLGDQPHVPDHGPPSPPLTVLENVQVRAAVARGPAARALLIPARAAWNGGAVRARCSRRWGWVEQGRAAGRRSLAYGRSQEAGARESPAGQRSRAPAARRADGGGWPPGGARCADGAGRRGSRASAGPHRACSPSTTWTSSSRWPSRIMVLHQGRVIADGTPAAVRAPTARCRPCTSARKP